MKSCVETVSKLYQLHLLLVIYFNRLQVQLLLCGVLTQLLREGFMVYGWSSSMFHFLLENVGEESLFPTHILRMDSSSAPDYLRFVHHIYSLHPTGTSR